MKYLLITFLVSTLGISDTFSQYVLIKKLKTNSSFTFGDIKANPLKDGSLVEARVSQLAIIAFKKSFENATNIKWYREGRNYLVYFKKNENVSRALYDAKGNLIYSFFMVLKKIYP